VAAREIALWSGLAIRELVLWGTLLACMAALPIVLVPTVNKQKLAARHKVHPSPTAPPPLPKPLITGSLVEPPKATVWMDQSYQPIPSDTAHEVDRSPRLAAGASLPVERRVTLRSKPKPKYTRRPIDFMQWSLP
jgi:hypothetical protein